MEADPSGDHDALCALLGDVSEIPVAVFLTYVLPPSPVDIDLLVKKLSGKTSARAKGDCVAASDAKFTVDFSLENFATLVTVCCVEIDVGLRPKALLKIGPKTKPGSGFAPADLERDGIHVVVSEHSTDEEPDSYNEMDVSATAF